MQGVLHGGPRRTGATRRAARRRPSGPLGPAGAERFARADRTDVADRADRSNRARGTHLADHPDLVVVVLVVCDVQASVVGSVRVIRPLNILGPLNFIGPATVLGPLDVAASTAVSAPTGGPSHLELWRNLARADDRSGPDGRCGGRRRVSWRRPSQTITAPNVRPPAMAEPTTRASRPGDIRRRRQVGHHQHDDRHGTPRSRRARAAPTSRAGQASEPWGKTASASNAATV